MITDFGNLRLSELRQDLQELNDTGMPLNQRLRGRLNSIRTALSDLNTYLKEHSFDGQGDEIYYFKNIKPQFDAIHICELETFKIETAKPAGNDLLIKNYYEQELGYIRRFFDKHQYFYQYYLWGGTELDVAYFTLDGRTDQFIIDEPLDIRWDHTTVGEYIFSRIIATEQIQNYLLNLLYDPLIPVIVAAK